MEMDEAKSHKKILWASDRGDVTVGMLMYQPHSLTGTTLIALRKLVCI